MPIYEYQCGGCGHRFEQLLKSRESRLEPCPECGGRKLERQLSAFAPAKAPEKGMPACASGSCATGMCGGGGCPMGGGH